MVFPGDKKVEEPRDELWAVTWIVKLCHALTPKMTSYFYLVGTDAVFLTFVNSSKRKGCILFSLVKRATALINFKMKITLKIPFSALWEVLLINCFSQCRKKV